MSDLNGTTNYIERQSDGTPMLAGSRVPLETIVSWFHRGATAEAIVEKYPSLSLASVYGSLAQYLDHRKEWDQVLTEKREDGERNRTAVRSQFNTGDLRSRLLARQSELVPS